MAKQFNDEISHYTPQFDFLVQYRDGNKLASVFGRIYRYCQMDKGKCFASMERMADEINMSPDTFRKHAIWLCNNGLLINETGEWKRGHIPVFSINYSELALQSKAQVSTLKNSYIDKETKRTVEGWEKPKITVVQ